MFIALTICHKKCIKKDFTQVTFPFKGVAYGQKVSWIIGEYDHYKYQFSFYKKEEYLVYLEGTRLVNECLYGKILYYQPVNNLKR